MSLFSNYRGRTWGGKRITHASQPTRQVHVEAPQCAWCSSRSKTRCEFPGCNVPLCWKHLVRKGGGNLCRNHQGARLVQQLGLPGIGAVAIAGEMSKRFKPKGPALPWIQ